MPAGNAGTAVSKLFNLTGHGFTYSILCLISDTSGWSEDMDATKEQSLIILGSRAGLSEDEIAHVIDVCNQAIQRK